VIVAEHMKRAVHYKSKQLFSSPDALSPGVLAGNLGANIHVADHRSATSHPLQPEGDDVGCTVVTEVAFVETRHRGASDERDREHRIPYAFRLERRDRGISDTRA